MNQSSIEIQRCSNGWILSLPRKENVFEPVDFDKQKEKKEIPLVPVLENTFVFTEFCKLTAFLIAMGENEKFK